MRKIFEMQKNRFIYLKQNEVDKFKLACSQFFLFLCVCLCVISIYVNLTYSVAPVSGLSMWPTLNGFEGYNYSNVRQDRVVLNYIKTPHKGDIIIAKKMYDNDDEHYIYVIKRLIAVGGDELEIKPNGAVVVNGVQLDESYVLSQNKVATYNGFMSLKGSEEHKGAFFDCFDGSVLTIPKGYVFYLGDNRGASSDCSSYGPVKEENVIAKVDFILYEGQSDFLCIIKQFFGVR